MSVRIQRVEEREKREEKVARGKNKEGENKTREKQA